MVTPSAFKVPSIDKRKRIPMRAIRALADYIAEKFDPEQIIIDITEKGKTLYERNR